MPTASLAEPNLLPDSRPVQTLKPELQTADKGVQWELPDDKGRHGIFGHSDSYLDASSYLELRKEYWPFGGGTVKQAKNTGLRSYHIDYQEQTVAESETMLDENESYQDLSTNSKQKNSSITNSNEHISLLRAVSGGVI